MLKYLGLTVAATALILPLSTVKAAQNQAGLDGSLTYSGYQPVTNPTFFTPRCFVLTARQTTFDMNRLCGGTVPKTTKTVEEAGTSAPITKVLSPGTGNCNTQRATTNSSSPCNGSTATDKLIGR